MGVGQCENVQICKCANWLARGTRGPNFKFQISNHHE